MAITKKTKPSQSRPYAIYQIDTLVDWVRFVIRSDSDGETVLFRGQGSNWPLIPKIARLNIDEEESILEVEKRMFYQFSRKAVSLDGTRLTRPLEILATAQHHGLPTRFLDWTEYPLVAIWFAVANVPVSAKNNGVVWIYTPDEDSFVNRSKVEKEGIFNIKKTMVYFPHHVSSRIRAQSGVFTFHAHNKNMKFSSLEKSNSEQYCLTKVVIPSSEFSNIRYELSTLGINRSMLFPDLDGLARELKDSNTYLDDEL